MTFTGSPKQLHAIGASDARVNLWDGSIRSGKTFSSIIRLLAAIAAAGPQGEIVIVGKNRDSIFRNVFAPIETIPELSWVAKQVKYRQGAATGKILGRRVNVIGAADAKAESRIRGMTVQLAYIDEVTVIPEDFFRQMLGRMSAPGAQMFGTTNPDSPQHWLKVKYLDRLKELPDWRHFKFRLDDNPTLTQEYKDSLEREYTGLWYKRFILGEWVAAEGAIFDMFNEEEHAVHPDDVPRIVRMFSAGIDYGTSNASSAVALGLGEDGVLYAVDEWRYEAGDTGQRLTDGQQSVLARDFIRRLDPAPEWVPVDPAAASFKVQLEADGVRNTMLAENDVLYGIRTMASLLAGGHLKVSKACTGLLGEMPGYAWDPKASKEGEDKPLKINDHGIDSMRYAITSTETLWRPYIDKH